jgi:hypothetical protein
MSKILSILAMAVTTGQDREELTRIIGLVTMLLALVKPRILLLLLNLRVGNGSLVFGLVDAGTSYV